MSDAIRILILGHEPLFRRGVAAVLATESDLLVVASADSAADAYTAADEHYPDVALIGTTLKDAPGLAAADEFHRRYPTIAVIVISSNATDEEFSRAIRASARAYTGQDFDETNLLSWIRRAAAGEYVINEQLIDNPAAAARMLAEYRSSFEGGELPDNAYTPLTARELEILQKMSEGMTNAEIGFALGISAQTVKNHVTSILRKMTVNDRTQAVVKALRNGWLSLD